MYLLTTFANRYKKELYKKQGLTPKSAQKQTAKVFEDYLNKNNTVGDTKSQAIKLARKESGEVNRQLNNQLKSAVTIEAGKSKGFKDYLPKTNNTVSKIITKPKLLTGKKLAIGAGAIVATGLGIAAVNRLRKSRSDKGKKRK